MASFDDELSLSNFLKVVSIGDFSLTFLKKRFRPAFGCAQHLKAGRNTQQFKMKNKIKTLPQNLDC